MLGFTQTAKYIVAQQRSEANENRRRRASRLILVVSCKVETIPFEFILVRVEKSGSEEKCLAPFIILTPFRLPGQRGQTLVAGLMSVQSCFMYVLKKAVAPKGANTKMVGIN